MSYYYTRDHLGSVREMCSSTGTITSRMVYDSYGRVTVVSGTVLPTMQYAGYFLHQTSGLNLTLAGDGQSTGRAYDAITGRWLSRDPIEEKGGTNLYGYVLDNPLNDIDPSGTDRAIAPGFLPGHIGVYVQVWSSDCCKPLKWIRIDFGPTWFGAGLEVGSGIALSRLNPYLGVGVALSIPVPGQVSMIYEDPPAGTTIYKSNCCDDNALLKKAFNDRAKPPKYSLLWYNCRTYAYQLINTKCN